MAPSAPSTKPNAKLASAHVALVRGINVGGRNKLAMKDLAALFLQANCRDVQTYIQSGNVVFCASAARASSIGSEISRLIKAKHGLSVPVVVRSRAQMRRIVMNNPFLKKGIDPTLLHVVFLADKPDRASIASLDATRSTGDSFVVQGDTIYLHLPNGVARSKLTAAYFDSTLHTISTQRNWRTATSLLAMMPG